MPETKIDDGGLAFPASRREKGDGAFWETVIYPGLSVRDYFAAKAMVALFQGCGEYYKDRGQFGNMMKRLAEDAYRAADLMISEKRKSK